MSIFGPETHKENIMSGPLDMAGNEIINLGNPNRPNDAVSRRFVFKKIQDTVRDYKLEDIEDIKNILKTEDEKIKQLTENIANNDRTIIELHNKIEEEIKIITDTMLILEKKTDKTDEEIKEVLRVNINEIGKHIKELKDTMINHIELKKQLNETEKKLKDVYKLEINKKINELKTSFTNENDKLLTRFSEYKSELEKAVSERGDKHDASVVVLREKFESLSNELTQQRTEFQNSFTALHNYYTELSDKVNKLETTIELEKVTTGKYIKEQEQHNLVFEKSIIDLDDLTKTILPKQISDIANVVLSLVNDNKTLKRKLSKLEKAVYEVPLFELYNNRVQEIHVLSASVGIPTEYGMTTSEIPETQKTPDFFAYFALSKSPVVDLMDYIKLYQEGSANRWTMVRGFKVVKEGRYTFEVNLNAKGNIKGFHFKGETTKSEFIESDEKKEITYDLKFDDFIFVYPEADNTEEDLKFTIESDSYVKVIYSWKYI